MKFYILLFIACFSITNSWGQKFHFATSVGSSYLAWSQNQQSLNTGVQLQYQKPGKPTQLFGQVNIIGNLQKTAIDGNSIAFRGGKAEIGLNRFMKSGLFSLASIYSISLVKKTSTTNQNYLSEQKFALHGLNVGLGYQSHGKIKTTSQIKLFEPVLHKVSLQTHRTNQESALSKAFGYQASIEFKLAKWALAFDYEKINYGQTYPSLQSLSTQLTYFF